MDMEPSDALRRACVEGDLAGAVAAIQDGANPNARREGDGQTALMDVARSGTQPVHDGILRYLIARGAEVDAMDLSGNTALDLAVAYGNFKVATVLIALGARGKKQTLAEFSRRRADDAGRASDLER